MQAEAEVRHLHRSERSMNLTTSTRDNLNRAWFAVAAVAGLAVMLPRVNLGSGLNAFDLVRENSQSPESMWGFPLGLVVGSTVAAGLLAAAALAAAVKPILLTRLVAGGMSLLATLLGGIEYLKLQEQVAVSMASVGLAPAFAVLAGVAGAVLCAVLLFSRNRNVAVGPPSTTSVPTTR
jgi:hypothetical protein